MLKTVEIYISVIIWGLTQLVVLVFDTCGLLRMEFTTFGVLLVVDATGTMDRAGFR